MTMYRQPKLKLTVTPMLFVSDEDGFYTMSYDPNTGEAWADLGAKHKVFWIENGDDLPTHMTAKELMEWFERFVMEWNEALAVHRVIPKV